LPFWLNYGKMIYNATAKRVGLRNSGLKSIKVLFALSLVTVIFLCSTSYVSALGTNEASVSVVWMNQPVHTGDTTTLLVTLTSSSSDKLTVTSIGLHFDWMQEGEFYTKHLEDSPVTIEANSGWVFDPITIQIPPFVGAGPHSYTVAILGTQGDSGDLAWESDSKTVDIVGFSTTPTPSTAPSSPGDVSVGGISLDTIAIIAAVVVVVVALVVVLLFRKRKTSKPATESSASTESKPTTPSPEEKPAPEQKPESSEEKPSGPDFSI
jgi:hypothetical protein